MKELTEADKRLLLNVLRSIREPVPQNLCPTFYRTLTYKGDLKLKEHADNLADKLGLTDKVNEL